MTMDCHQILKTRTRRTATLLHHFYGEVRTNDEKNYSTQGLVNLHSGLCRYLQR